MTPTRSCGYRAAPHIIMYTQTHTRRRQFVWDVTSALSVYDVIANWQMNNRNGSGLSLSAANQMEPRGVEFAISPPRYAIYSMYYGKCYALLARPEFAVCVFVCDDFGGTLRPMSRRKRR